VEQVGACNPGSNDRTGELLGAVTDMEPGSDVGPQEDGSGSDDEVDNEALLEKMIMRRKMKILRVMIAKMSFITDIPFEVALLPTWTMDLKKSALAITVASNIKFYHFVNKIHHRLR